MPISIYMCYKCGELGALWVPDHSFIHAYELVRISEIWKLTLVPGWKAEIQGWQATGSFGTHRVQAPLSSLGSPGSLGLHGHGAPAQAPPPGWGSVRWGVCSSTIWDPFWGEVIFSAFILLSLKTKTRNTRKNKELPNSCSVIFLLAPKSKGCVSLNTIKNCLSFSTGAY